MKVIILTGLSGAGKTASRQCLEDLGFETIDNLPVSLLTQALKDAKKSVAIDIDIRSRDFSTHDVCKTVKDLKVHYDIQLVYLYSDPAVLSHRYRQSRRQHPVSADLDHAIMSEQKIFQGMAQKADYVIDTSYLTLPELRTLWWQFCGIHGDAFPLSFMSFAYPIGIPRQACFVWDMRCLKNPHYHETLAPYTGQEDCVQQFLWQDPLWEEMFKDMKNTLTQVVHRLQSEGRKGLMVATGCTGGKHRSVFAACMLYKWTQDISQWSATLHHRELDTSARTIGG